MDDFFIDIRKYIDDEEAKEKYNNFTNDEEKNINKNDIFFSIKKENI